MPRNPLLDFSGKKLRDDLPPRPTTGDITSKKKLITVRLYPTPDLPTPTLANERVMVVVLDKSKDSLSLSNNKSARSTTPNPKRVKYEITGR